MAFAPITPSEFDAIVESLGESCNDATFSLKGEIMTIQFAREADDLNLATRSAFNDICNSAVFMGHEHLMMVGMSTPLFPPPNYVTPDAAARLFINNYAGCQSSLYDDLADEFAELVTPDTFTEEQIKNHFIAHCNSPENAATTPITGEAPSLCPRIEKP
jgi:hypothetical protein